MLYHTASAAITGQRFLTMPKTFLTLDLEDQSRKIRTIQKFAIWRMPQTKVQAQFQNEKLCSIQNTLRHATRPLARMAGGTMNTFRQKPCTALLSNFFPILDYLSKKTDIRDALEARERISTVDALKPHLSQSKKRGGTANKFEKLLPLLTRKATETRRGSRTMETRRTHCQPGRIRTKGHHGSFIRLRRHVRREPEKITIVKHYLDLKPDTRAAFHHLYRAGFGKREHEGQDTDEMPKEDVIEHAMSDWASTVLFAPKKNGNLRFCADHGKLNAMIVRSKYLLRRMYECTD